MTTARKTPAERVAEIRARLKAATPGPWIFRGKDSSIRNPGEPPYPYASGVIARFYENDDGAAQIGDADLDLILSAPADIEWLLARLERAEAREVELLSDGVARENDLSAARAEVERLKAENIRLVSDLDQARGFVEGAKQGADLLKAELERLTKELDEARADRHALDVSNANLVEEATGIINELAVSERNYLSAVNGRREFRSAYRAVINERDALKQRVAELEAALAEEKADCLQAIAERDAFGDRISEIADALGDETEWSNLNDRGSNALELAEQAIAERDEARKQLADANYWRERHGKDAIALGQRSNELWQQLAKAIDERDRGVAAYHQLERERVRSTHALRTQLAEARAALERIAAVRTESQCVDFARAALAKLDALAESTRPADVSKKCKKVNTSQHTKTVDCECGGGKTGCADCFGDGFRSAKEGE